MNSLKPTTEPAGEENWQACMRGGDFAAAWRMTDRAVRERAGVPCWHWPRHFQYLWDGRPLAGKRVLVHCYHGLGDTVQFIRYATLLKTVAREVLVWAQPALLPVLGRVRGIDRLLPLHDGEPGVERDADVELMELPHVFRSTCETLPREVPYLHVQPLEVVRAGSGERKVGLVWRSGNWDERRSLPLTSLRPLLDVAGIRWVILQNGIRTWELPSERCTFLGEHSVETAARVVRTLDLVITVDTFAAHLAGALAVPTWTLLHADPDWRWLQERNDSPWYPTMTLFRQQRAGDWDGVVARVAEALRDWANENSPR